ncbi:MAG: hypothetical protein SGPRY_000603 [Prymnesium sp.]
MRTHAFAPACHVQRAPLATHCGCCRAEHLGREELEERSHAKKPTDSTALSVAMVETASNCGSMLSELRALKEALNEGLVTEEEQKRFKQQVLNKFQAAPVSSVAASSVQGSISAQGSAVDIVAVDCFFSWQLSFCAWECDHESRGRGEGQLLD